MDKNNEKSESNKRCSQPMSILLVKNNSQLSNNICNQPFYLHFSPYGSPSNLFNNSHQSDLTNYYSITVPPAPPPSDNNKK